MKLGTHSQISISVKNLSESLSFYVKLGFYKLSESAKPIPSAIITDGNINVELYQSEFPSPLLSYFAGDMKSRVQHFQNLGLPFSKDNINFGFSNQDIFFDPNDLCVAMIHSEGGKQQLNGAPLSLCGTFGELSIPVKDLHAAQHFWEEFEFKKVYGETAPYPWAILTDEIMTIGLHQSPELTKPAFTYFSRNSVERIAMLKDDGVQFIVEIKNQNGKISNAITQSPEGQLIFIFYGEV